MTRFPPELLERYEYLNLLGKGGMGIVYLARDLVLGRTVAIKTLSSAAATESQLIRFQKEARAAAKLNHDHIVRVIDFGIMKNGDPYMVMDYVQGSDLNEYLKAPERNQKLLLVLDLAIQIVGALAHAHGQGVVHRDLKSANIVVTEDDDGEPRAMVIDFGIAQLSTLAVPADNTLFESTGNAVIGSPGYISPESIKADRVDFRTDIYSFGCVFFEMLTGKLPYIGETALATMEMHIKAIVPSVVPFELRLL
ncbi:MAG: serine/threonine protein kinase, partial [Cyanobacteria bacterium HKST-UBA01]|nr:serine/threonine protein kinase [Cyanobacteria bacterium HKST-UBA01]